MPGKMNLGYLKLLYCEFQKYEVMTMSVVGGQPKKHANPSYKATKHMELTFLTSDSILLANMYLTWNTHGHAVTVVKANSRLLQQLINTITLNFWEEAQKTHSLWFEASPKESRLLG